MLELLHQHRFNFENFCSYGKIHIFDQEVQCPPIINKGNQGGQVGYLPDFHPGDLGSALDWGNQPTNKKSKPPSGLNDQSRKVYFKNLLVILIIWGCHGLTFITRISVLRFKFTLFYHFWSRNLLPTSDSQAPLISVLLSHMSI